MKRFIPLLLLLSGCYKEWDWPAAPPKHVKKEQCIKIVNGRYMYIDDCKYWGHIPSSEATPLLPP